ncbi:MAG: hypothetical protein ACI9Z3_000854 [Roseivirga sp.]|jgi:hypothetical protein
MSEDLSFLAHFITEDLYLIKEERSIVEVTAVVEPAKTVQPIVEVNSAEEKTAQVEEKEQIYIKPLPTEGHNLKHCLIFFESSQNNLEASKKAFLLKILTAVKRGVDDVLLVNVKEASKEQIDAVLSEFNHRHVLAFATTKLDSIISTPRYEVKEDAKKFYLKADDLGKIEETVELKKSLWAGLQKMFL